MALCKQDAYLQPQLKAVCTVICTCDSIAVSAFRVVLDVARNQRSTGFDAL